jgi:AcrR family transcriptional regulator
MKLNEARLPEAERVAGSRRGKGRPLTPVVDPDQVLRAALKLIDQEGLDGFTMRLLAERVGVEVGSLYNHFANKEAILYGALDLASTEHMVNLAPRGDWKRWMAEGTRGFRAVLIDQPGLFSVIQRRNENEHGSPFQDYAAAQLARLGAPREVILPLLNTMAYMCIASAMNHHHARTRTAGSEQRAYPDYPNLAELADESDPGDEETFMVACRSVIRAYARGSAR